MIVIALTQTRAIDELETAVADAVLSLALGKAGTLSTVNRAVCDDVINLF